MTTDADAPVEDILSMIKKGTTTGQGDDKCLLMQKVAELDGNLRTAVEMAIEDSEVTNDRITGFINGSTPIKTSRTAVQNHRNKVVGCLICGTKIGEDSA